MAADTKALKNLVRWFIKPLMKTKPRAITPDDFINKNLFHTDTRGFERYIATRTFQMLGVPYSYPIINRVVKDTQFLVRSDDVLKQVWVEEIGGDRIWTLNNDEWERTEKWLEKE